MTKTREREDTDVLDEVKESYSIVVYNDDVNSFDHVIESFMEILGHRQEQAYQCAIIIHNNGKCGVKNGDFETLRPMAEALIDRGINATIE